MSSSKIDDPCPNCKTPNPHELGTCVECGHDLSGISHDEWKVRAKGAEAELERVTKNRDALFEEAKFAHENAMELRRQRNVYRDAGRVTEVEFYRLSGILANIRDGVERSQAASTSDLLTAWLHAFKRDYIDADPPEVVRGELASYIPIQKTMQILLEEHPDLEAWKPGPVLLVKPPKEGA